MTKNNSTKSNDEKIFTKSDASNSKPIIKYVIDDFFDKTVKNDFEKLTSKVSLATTPRIEQLHLMHSIYGHACEGHGEFYEMSGSQRIPVQYKNITLEDVIEKIPKQNIERVKRDRQESINNISEWLYDRIETLRDPGRMPLPEDIRMIKIFDDTNGKDKNSKKRIEPLAGALMFEYAILKNFESVLIGFYLGSCMDSYEWREKVDAKFGITMHKGTSVPVDIFALRRNDLTLDDLQNSEYVKKLPYLSDLDSEERIETLIANGIIPKKNSVANDKHYTSAFLELSKGYGISDDAAFITASLLFGIEAGFGLLLADAIDTLDKCTPKIMFGGQDESIGKVMKKKYESRLNKEFPVSEDQILTMIYLAAIDKENRTNFPSCSQRRFWQKDEHDLTAVQSHMSFLNFLKGDSKYPPQTKVGFSKILNSQFYTAYVKKLEEAISKGIIFDKYNLLDKKHMLNINQDVLLSID